MAGNRRSGGGGNFDMSYTRRQGNMDMNSLLGSPPTRQSNQGGYSGPNQNQSYGNNNYGGSGGGGGNYGNSGGYGGNQFQGRGNQDFGGGNNNPVWSKDQSPQQRRGGNMGNNDSWNRGNNFDMPNQGGMQSLPMGQGSNLGQGTDRQQVVMVVPQGNTGAGGIMGMVPVQGSQNPFNMMNRQQPMQVILNADAFSQQILAAASGGPGYGQGMMGGPPMGGGGNMNQRQQQRFGDGGGDGGRRFSARQNNGRTPGGRATGVTRRSDISSGGNSNNKTLNRGSINNSTANNRGNRKRGGVLRDRHGATDEIVNKRAKPTVPPQKQVGQINKGNKGKGNKAAQKKNRAAAAALKKENEGKKDEAAKKEGDAKEEGKDGEAKAEGEEGKTDGEPKISKYDDFPNVFLVCKICQKVMSDGNSFESHLNGRAHLALVKILESRFQKRAELLMFESKQSEEEIAVEMERQRRAGKSGHGKGSKNYCKMCDCNYTVNWGTHKISMGHRVLKEYLHPTCRYCNTNFVHRMDWVNHLYSLNHLKKLTELKEQGVDLEEQESCCQDELFFINLEIGKEEHATPVVVIRPTDYKLPTKEDLKEMLKEEKGELILPEGEIDIPKEYVETQAYGEDAITNVEGACCKVCRTYIGNRSDIEAHVRSKPHYGMYVSYLKKIVKYRENLIAEKEKAEKEAAELAERLKKKAEEEAAAALKKEEEEKLKKEAPMETDASAAAETPKEGEVKVEGAVDKMDVTPATGEAVDGKVEPAGDAAVTEEKKEGETAASPAKDAATPAAKATPANRGGQSARRAGGPRGGRGGSPAANRGSRGSRGGQSPRGGARGTMRGGRTPGRGGESNWSPRGGPARGGRGRGGYQR